MKTLEERFLEKVEKTHGGCWLWRAARFKDGYGMFTVARETGARGRATLRAHRAAYEMWRGPVGDLLVCHRCDVRHCVNPAHLFLGAVRDNYDDMVRKGRRNTMRKLTAENVIAIRNDTVTTNVALAKVYGVTDARISQVRRYK